MGTTTVELAQFDGLKRAWEQSRREATPVADWATQLAGMRNVQRRIVDAGDWTSGPSDLLSVLRIQHREVLNCRILRWVLDPLARHGAAPEVLGRLALELGLPLGNERAVSVDAEVAVDKARADLVLTGDGGAWTVVVEAKIDAAEGPRQAARLEEDWPEASLVFLTRSGTSIPGTAGEPERWTPLSWGWFGRAAAEAIEGLPAVANPRVLEARAAVRTWATATIRRLR